MTLSQDSCQLKSFHSNPSPWQLYGVVPQVRSVTTHRKGPEEAAFPMCRSRNGHGVPPTLLRCSLRFTKGVPSSLPRPSSGKVGNVVDLTNKNCALQVFMTLVPAQ